MADQETIAVPDVIGLTRPTAEARLKNAGLLVGTVTTVSTDKTPAGSVKSSNPTAGASVSLGTPVNLEVSSGLIQVAVPNVVSTTQPASQVAVPDVVGLTRPAAEAILKNAGLQVGAVKTQHSDSIPAGGVSSTHPDAGTLVNLSTAVELDLSSGPEPNWTQYIPTVLFAILGLIVLGVIAYIVTESGQAFLNKLAEKEIARGLITFLIAIATVGIAIILAISTLVLTEGDEGDKRFDRGKQVLSILIGVLGTIVGFYFGSAPETKSAPPKMTTTEQARTLAITTTALPDGAVNRAYPSTTLQATGGTPPLKWSVIPTLPADLTLSAATGTISGKTTTALPKTKFTFRITDSATPTATSTTDLTLEIK
jgi:hypothetical protein